MTRYKRPNNLIVSLDWLKSFTVEDLKKCWIWQRSLTNKGYAQVSYRGTMHLAHRVMYLVCFEDPGELCVLHHCDTPACINPERLFVGTPQDNALDRESKGRGGGHKLRGAACHTAKLTENQVKRIRKDPRPTRELVKLYRVSRGTIQKVRAERGKRTWENV